MEVKVALASSGTKGSLVQQAAMAAT